MDSSQLMLEAGQYLPPHVSPWTTFMQLVLFLLPLLFLKHTAPRVIVLTQVINIVVAYQVFVAEGDQVTRLVRAGSLLLDMARGLSFPGP